MRSDHVLSGKTMDFTVFEETYLKPILVNCSSMNVVIFSQDQLSLTDITLNSGLFEPHQDVVSFPFMHLRDLMLQLTVIALPKVGLPSADEHISPAYSFLAHIPIQTLEAPYQIESLKLDPNACNIIVVNLPSSQGPIAVFREKIKIIDGIIGSVSEQLSALSQPYVAMYSALKPHKIELVSSESKRRSRHLSSAENQSDASSQNKTAVVYKPGKLLLYIEAVIHTGKISMPNVMPANEGGWAVIDENNNSTCNEAQCTVIRAKDGLTLNLTTVKEARTGYWSVSEFTVRYLEEEFTIDVKKKIDYIPLGQSFHCHASLIFTHKDTTTLTLVGFQLQAFGLKTFVKGGKTLEKFGYYYDCEGFFSPGIWMGIITGLIFFGVIIWAVFMLSNLNSVDRLDNPRGRIADLKGEN